VRWTIAICALLGLAALQDAAPKIHKEGKLEFPVGCAVDLDEGHVGFGGRSGVDGDGSNTVFVDEGAHDSPLPLNGDFPGSDFWFEGGKHRFLHPQHGTKFSTGVVAKEGYAACAESVFTNHIIRVDDFKPGAQLCVRTSDARYASIHIMEYSPQTNRMYLTYTTWEK
jgi:hypothetical protein